MIAVISGFFRRRDTMAHAPARYTGPNTIDDLIADRQRMWAGFTSATVGVVIFMIVLLVGMAVFLL
jgi:hypothetical protein